MANRVLRDWTDSEKINSLSAHAERFFTRLIMKVDDFGRFYSNTSLLKANLFPMLLDSIREADITRWLAECQKAGIIILYEINNKGYLQIEVFKQRLRKMVSKFPAPSIVSNPPPESETKPESETGKGNEYEGQKIFFRINDEVYKYPVSDYLKDNFGPFLEQWEMKHGKILFDEVYAEVDTKYHSTTFTGVNHVKNAFTKTWEIIEGQKGKSTPMSVINKSLSEEIKKRHANKH